MTTMTKYNQSEEKGEYVTTVLGEVITNALSAQLDDIEHGIAEELKARNYTGIKLLSEKAEKLESLRMSICTNHLMVIYDIGTERDQREQAKHDQ
jgi:hypothetical protein